MRQVVQDLRFSLRLMRKQRGFAVLATGCIALGIGATTAVFSLLNSLLLRSLPFHSATRLVVLHRGKNLRFSYPDYKDLASWFQTSGSMLATLPTESSLDRTGYQGQLVTAEAVSGNYAAVLQAGTTLGDWFDNEESPAAVISYRAWQELFHGDPKALGQQIRSETQWYTIIGVAPRDFTGLALPRSTSIWVPLHAWARQHPNMQARVENRDSPLVTIVARLSATSAGFEGAAKLRTAGDRLNRESVRKTFFRDPIAAEPLRGVIGSGDRAVVLQIGDLLFAVTGLLMLICCLNVGNLLLVRGTSRRQEVAIRYSLGATRRRLAWQLLMDSVLLAAFGAAAGLLVSVLLVRLLLHLVPALPLGETISPNVAVDGRVIAFVAASALATVFVFGPLPAWKGSSADLSARAGRAIQGMKLRKSFAIGQVLLSFVLLGLAALFLNTCRHLENLNPGFQVRNRVYATTYISKPEFKPDQFPDFYQHVLADLRSMPNIRSAGLTYLLPLTLPDTECVKGAVSGEMQATTSVVSPGFLHTLGIPVLRGRDFDVSDRAGSSPVVLINQQLADTLWPRSSPLGREIQLGCSEHSAATVIGVVANSRTVSLTQLPGAHVYRAFAQNATGLANIVVETSGPPARMIEQLRRELLNEGHGMRIYAVNQLLQHVEQSYWQLQWESWLLAAFGAAALLLAALGLYSVIAYTTALRTKEFALRIALGAHSADVLRLVAKDGIVMTVTGVSLGSIAVFSLEGLLRTYLVDDVRSVAFVCLAGGLLWLVVVSAASYLPVRRSCRLDPSATLRDE